MRFPNYKLALIRPDGEVEVLADVEGHLEDLGEDARDLSDSELWSSIADEFSEEATAAVCRIKKGAA